MPEKIEISPKAILYLVALVALGWLLIQIRDILALLFIAFIFMSTLRPAVERLEAMRFPRLVAVFVVYFCVIAAVVGFGSLVIPPLVTQSVKLVTHLPDYFTRVVPFINTNLDTVLNQVTPIGQNVLRVTVGVFSDFVAMLSIAVFTFYFLLERRHMRQHLETFVGKELGQRIVNIIHKVEGRLGAWVRGEAMLAAIIGLASFLGLTLLGVNYALPLALIAGVLEVVPVIGPIISAVPAVLVGLTVSTELAVVVALLYFIIQQLENNLVVPQVMRKAVGVPPLASLLALMVGGRLAGTMGIILAVPVLLVAQTIVQEFLTNQRTKLT